MDATTTAKTWAREHGLPEEAVERQGRTVAPWEGGICYTPDLPEDVQPWEPRGDSHDALIWLREDVRRINPDWDTDEVLESPGYGRVYALLCKGNGTEEWPALYVWRSFGSLETGEEPF